MKAIIYTRVSTAEQGKSSLGLQSQLDAVSVVYAKQANITNGNQQINNGVPAPRTQENIKYSNELLTELPNATLDNGRTVEAIPVNSELATVE